jgi:hypothetical protein
VSFLDRIRGRTKKTVGEAVDEREQQRVQDKAAEVAELEREEPGS